jgi:hypothetical protein
LVFLSQAARKGGFFYSLSDLFHKYTQMRIYEKDQRLSDLQPHGPSGSAIGAASL